MTRDRAWGGFFAALGAAATLSIISVTAHGEDAAKGDDLIVQSAPSSYRGPLFANAAAVAAKAAANRAREAAEQSATASGSDPAAPGLPSAAPTISGGFNFAGLTDNVNLISPAQAAGAIGTNRYVQAVNSRAGIYNRTTKALIASGQLRELGGTAAESHSPQIIWDAKTNRFYYAMSTTVSQTNHRLLFGYSKSASPNNLTTDWCHYDIALGSRFADYPKLGDSQHFIIIGVNSYIGAFGFVGSDLHAINKPPGGAACQAASAQKRGVKKNLKDLGDPGVPRPPDLVFTPVPANQIDDLATGYAIAGPVSPPGPGPTRFWIYTVTRGGTGLPVFSLAKEVTVPLPNKFHFQPPDATQPGSALLLDTLDARLTNAVMAFNPTRVKNSLWTQHTIATSATGARSIVAWYEIDPVPVAPVMLASGQIGAAAANANNFFFNAAISPDRRVDGATKQFGSSFVINYNVSSGNNNVPARIMASSSVNGAAVGAATLNVKLGVGKYIDTSCAFGDSVCDWGNQAGASPDPRPPPTTPPRTKGLVWGTNQYSGVASPTPNATNFRTQIFAVQP